MTYKTKFIFDGIVYVENCVNDKRSYAKLIDGKEVPVSDAEINKFQKVYNNYTSYVIADYYLSKNMQITDPKVRNTIRPVLAKVESILPIAYRNPFYNNLKTMKFILEKESMEHDATYRIDISEEGILLPSLHIATYFPSINTISINKTYFQSMLKSSGIKIAVDNLQSAIFHELLHMASFETRVGYYGQGFNSSESPTTYLALDEGYTELLSAIYFPKEFMGHGYTINSLLVLQLLYLVGKDTLDEAYLKDHSINPIIKKLWSIIPNRKMAYKLIKLIEQVYKSMDINTDYLRKVEFLMGRYLNAKIKQEILDNVSLETINNQINKFESALITKEKLEYIGLSPNNHRDIALVEDDFHKWTEAIYTSPLKSL